MEYDTQNEAIRIAEILSINDELNIRFIKSSLEIAFTAGQLQQVRESGKALDVVTGEL